MTSEQKQILTNIIGAVESGGQVYGSRRYDAYAGAYANSPNEVTCTLGWAQNYGYEAMKLCKMILEKDPKAFHEADDAGIEARLNVDWVAVKWNPNADQKQALIRIITTNTGKKCQDELCEQLMDKYIKEALTYDHSMSVGAQMMWCEIEHLGGLLPTKRIFNRATKPYTPDSIYQSLLKDQQDTSNNNQVGDKIYQSRHQKCVEWIKKYVTEDSKEEKLEMTEQQMRQNVVDYLKQYVGIREGSQAHKDILNTFNGSGLCARYKMTVYDAWCATAVSAAFIANGYAGKPGSGALFQCVECSCWYMTELAKQQGIWQENDAYRAKVGDVVMYDWQDSGSGDNQGTPDHVGIVSSVNGNVMRIIEGNRNDSVAYRDLNVNGLYIRGFITPNYAKYAKKEDSNPSVKPVEPSKPEPVKPSTPTSLKAKSKSIFTVSGTVDPNHSEVRVGKCTADLLNVRTWAGTEFPNIKSYPQIAEGNLVSVCDSIQDSKGATWYFIKIANRVYGFVSAKYIALQ